MKALLIATNIGELLFNYNLSVPFFWGFRPQNQTSIYEKIKQLIEKVDHNIVIDKNTYQVCEAIIGKTGKTWNELKDISDTEIDYYLNTLNLHNLRSPFYNTISSIFNNYAVGLDKILYENYKKDTNIDKNSLIEKYQKEFGFSQMKPWHFLNEVLSSFNLDYEFIEPEVIYRTSQINPVQIKNKITGFISNNDFSFLSSGEKTILSLLFALINTKGIKPQIIILDEYEATLNASLVGTFYDIIKKYFIDKDILVIIITHSVATISMAPKYADFYEVFKSNNNPRIAKVEKDRYSDIKLALEEYYLKESLLKEEIMKLENQINQSSKDIILFVEGETDKIILENAWEKLYPNEEMNFGIQNSYGAGFINKKLRSNELFQRNPSYTFIGMFDFDEEGYNQWNGLKDGWVQFESTLCKKHNTHKGFTFLLPVPDLRKSDASEELKNKSYMPIEFLFKDDKIQDICIKEKSRGCITLLYIKDEGKMEFAKSTQSFTAEDFENFRAIFELINKIISESPKL